MLNVTLYSDGGGEKSSSAAGACVIDGATPEPIKLGIFLGDATNNEGEICAALLGFSFLQIQREQDLSLISVHWVADSEYMLKSATGYIKNWLKNGWKTATKQPVKNQGLWQAYLHLSRGLKISAEHVRGHSGHLQNESCDDASTWIRNNGDDVFSKSKSLTQVNILGNPLGTNWLIVDGRDFLRNLRCDLPNQEDIEILINCLNSQIANIPSASTNQSNSKPEASKLLASLKDALKEAKKIQKKDPEFQQITRKIESIITKL